MEPWASDVCAAAIPAAAVAAVAALHDESRRRLYEFVRRQRRPVTREEAADALGISRKIAAFHLDKLVEVGLLATRVEPTRVEPTRVEHGRVEHGSGQRRPGRRPKRYESSGVDLRVAVPDRRPDLLAGILVEAVLDDSEEHPRSAALRIAHEHGGAIGAAERHAVRPGRLGAERALSLAESLLCRYGFEPSRQTPTAVRLHNCPFHPIAGRSPTFVFAINHAFITGLLDGLQAHNAQATLAPRAGECCVELHS